MNSLHRQRFIVRTSLGYAILASLWIFVSDQLLSAFTDIGALVWLSTAKGITFVIVTTLLLYFALQVAPAAPPASTTGTDGPALKNLRQRIGLYVFAALLSLAMLMLCMAIPVPDGSGPLLILLVFPITLSALFGGLGAGLVATCLSALGANLLLIAPSSSLAIASPVDLFQWTMLIADGVLVSILSEGLHRARRRAENGRQEQAATAEKLRESEYRLRLFIDNAPAALAMLDTRLHYVAASRRWSSDYHLEPDEIIGKSHYEIFPELPERWKEIHRRCLAGAIESCDEDPFPRADGAIDWLRWEIRPWHDAGGAIGGILIASETITGQVKAREAIRKLSLVVEQSPENVVITNTAAEIEYVNPAFIRNTGYELAEVMGRNPRLLSSGHTPPETYSDLWRALRDGRPWSGELYNRRKNGEEFVEFVTISPLRQTDGRITHYVAVKADITDKKRLEEELDLHRHHLEELVVERTRQLAMAKAAAEAANQAKSSFLANMSHEIRTPMNGILGMAHLMRRDGVTAKQSERLDKIDASGWHLLGIINNILDLSKIEAGKFFLEPKEFVLSDFLRGLVAIVGDAASAKGLPLKINVSGMPHRLHGDTTRLTQALVNYLSNAIKFTEQGSIALTGKQLEETNTGYLLRFEVSDTGVGLTSEQKNRLFVAFEQADPSIARKYGGTGLGLTITRRIVEMMGGEVGIDSAPGKGSTFWLTVRLGKGSNVFEPEELQASANAEATLRREHHGRRVLLADDEPINQEIVRELLTQAGLQLELAGNGIEALRMATENDYDAILMDIQMPEMDGLEATRALRRLPDRGAVPIVAMTANAFSEDRDRCLAAGMSDFIAKPADPGCLFATLLKWLGRERHSELALTAPSPADRHPGAANPGGW